MLHDARQVNGGFHAGVPAADYRYAFALKQRTIAVRAVGHALGAILIFARHVHIAPFRPGGDDDATRLEHRAGGGFDLMQAALCRRRRQFGRTLGVDHVDVIVIDVRFQRACQLLAFGFRHRNIVFDIHGIQHLTAEAFAHQAGTNPFTCRVDRRRRAGRAGANDQYIVSVTLIQLFRCAFFRTGIHFGDDFSQRHPSLTKLLTVHEHRWHAHDVTLGDLILEGPAVNRRVFDARVEHRHQVQGLDHVRAVMTGERIVGFEFEIAINIADLLQQRLGLFRRMTAGPQQRQHQRGKLVAQRGACKTRALVGTWVSNQERWLAYRQRVVFFKGDFV